MKIGLFFHSLMRYKGERMLWRTNEFYGVCFLPLYREDGVSYDDGNRQEVEENERLYGD